VDVPGYAIPASAAQPNDVRLDTLDARLTQAVSAMDPSRLNRVGLWTQHTVFGGRGAEVRWYEINPFTRVVMRRGEVSSSRLFIFNAAVSPDRAVMGPNARFGDSMVLGFNGSSRNRSSFIAYVAKTGDLPQSEMTVIRRSRGPANDFTCHPPFSFGVCRWGDYSAATPDPAVERGAVHGRVWLTNMWNIRSRNMRNIDWRSWNFAVEFPTGPGGFGG
jgi:hypothetical protein